MSYVQPISGPRGSTFLVHIEGLTPYIGMDIVIQFFDPVEGAGLRLDNAGPVRINGDTVELHPQVPLGSAYEYKTYEVGYVVWNPYPDKRVTSYVFAAFTVIEGPPPPPPPPPPNGGNGNGSVPPELDLGSLVLALAPLAIVVGSFIFTKKKKS